MAFDSSPSVWIPDGYSLASSVVGFTTETAGANIALTKLTDTQADPTTGDIRDVMRALCYMMFQAWTDQASANRPVKMRLNKTVTALADLTTLREVYTMSFDVESDPQGVVPEP